MAAIAGGVLTQDIGRDQRRQLSAVGRDFRRWHRHRERSLVRRRGRLGLVTRFLSLGGRSCSSMSTYGAAAAAIDADAGPSQDCFGQTGDYGGIGGRR